MSDLIAAPAVFALEAIIHPRVRRQKWLTEVSENTGRQDWAHLLILVALALALALAHSAILALVHMLKARRPAIVHIGAGIALFGVVSLVVVVSTSPRIPAISSTSGCPATSGGEIWLTKIYRNWHRKLPVARPLLGNTPSARNVPARALPRNEALLPCQ